MELVINGIKVNSSTTLEFKTNPKRQNSKAHARYEKYQAASSLEEYFEIAESKFAKADLRFDIEKGHLQLINDEGEYLTEPEVVDEEDMVEEIEELMNEDELETE